MESIKNSFIYCTAFITGMCVMAMEISSSRLIAPYFGSSLFVWSNIIGVVLISLAFGYWLGGKLTTQKNGFIIFLSLLFIAGIFFFLTPFLMPIIGKIFIQKNNIAHLSKNLFFGSLLSMISLFGIPIIILGTTGPVLSFIHSSLNKNKSIGQTTGSVFGFSTLGSVVGTFLPTLLFIPQFGTKNTIFIFSGIVFINALYGFFKLQLKYGFFLIIFATLFFIPFFSKNTQENKDIIYEGESLYNHVVVKKNNDKYYLYFNNKNIVQSVFSPNEKLTNSAYDFFTLIPFLNHNDKKIPYKALVIGFGGGTISRQLLQEKENIEIDGVEIDEKIIAIAKNIFKIENPKLTIYNTDGRAYLSASQKKYDAVIINAYSNEFYIPWHITTKEFWSLVHNHLSETGVATMNIAVPDQNLYLFDAIANTASSVFKNSAFLQTGVGYGGKNFMLLLSKKTLNLELLSFLENKEHLTPLINHINKNIKNYLYDSQKIILTDDRAPIEILTDAPNFLN